MYFVITKVGEMSRWIENLELDGKYSIMPNNDFHLGSQRLRFGLWSCDMLELAERLWLNPEVSRYIIG